MDLLLDTHTFIWFLNGDSLLPGSVKNVIADASNNCFISIASIWETAIKVSLKKLSLQGEFSKIAVFLSDNNIEILSVTFAHIQRLLTLDFHHRDPFDRIIISQALTENMTVVTKDGIFDQYEIDIVWA